MEEITEKEIAKYSSLKGKARGMAIRGEAEYIFSKMGKEGLEKLEREMERIGCPVVYKKLKVMGFYPIKYETLTTVVLEKVFGFKDDDFRKAGIYESKVSFIIRMFIKYFYSINAMARQVPKIWDKYYDFGRLEVSNLDQKKRVGTLMIRDFDHHPHFCRTLEGFIGSLMGMITKTDAVCKEVKCPHWGNEYHEFSLKW